MMFQDTIVFNFFFVYFLNLLMLTIFFNLCVYKFNDLFSQFFIKFFIFYILCSFMGVPPLSIFFVKFYFIKLYIIKLNWIVFAFFFFFNTFVIYFYYLNLKKYLFRQIKLKQIQYQSDLNQLNQKNLLFSICIYILYNTLFFFFLDLHFLF